MKKLLFALAIVGLIATNTMQADRGGAFVGGFFAGALTGALVAGATECNDYVYYDASVYDRFYPETTRYGMYDYPAYEYYPGYAYGVDVPVYLYPAGYYYAYY